VRSEPLHQNHGATAMRTEPCAGRPWFGSRLYSPAPIGLFRLGVVVVNSHYSVIIRHFNHLPFGILNLRRYRDYPIRQSRTGSGTRCASGSGPSESTLK
jgi:hypothetical protein